MIATIKFQIITISLFPNGSQWFMYCLVEKSDGHMKFMSFAVKFMKLWYVIIRSWVGCQDLISDNNFQVIRVPLLLLFSIVILLHSSLTVLKLSHILTDYMSFIFSFSVFFPPSHLAETIKFWLNILHTRNFIYQSADIFLLPKCMKWLFSNNEMVRIGYYNIHITISSQKLIIVRVV